MTALLDPLSGARRDVVPGPRVRVRPHAEGVRFRPQTLAAVDAVRRALRLAGDAAGTADVHAKADRDVVTSADVEAEQVIRQVLAEAAGLPVVATSRAAGRRAPARRTGWSIRSAGAGTTPAERRCTA